MPNADHVRLALRGSVPLSEWRAEHRGIRLDLRHAILSHKDLSGLNLSEADFRTADLSNSDLSGSDLRGADFRWATLTKANLSRANLVGADLSGALLDSAQLSNADLSDANLRDTVFFETILGNTNLARARNLGAAIHYGPSTLDYRTLRRSPDLPRAFLEGCGLPDSFIEYLPSLSTGQPMRFYSCFISFSQEDQAFANGLYRDLRKAGVRCWYAAEDMKIGDRIRSRIDEAIHHHDKLLLVLSAESIRSDWVESEAEAAMERERREGRILLYPVMLDDTVMNTRTPWAAEIRRTRHIGDFLKWKDGRSYRKSLNRLLRDLKQGT